MKIKNTIIVAGLLIGLFLLILTTNPERTWLIVNGSEAEAFANYLLSDSKTEAPEWSLDMVVVKNNEMVTFSNHHGNMYLAYSPTKQPSNTVISWSHAWGSWYIGKTKT